MAVHGPCGEKCRVSQHTLESRGWGGVVRTHSVSLSRSLRGLLQEAKCDRVRLWHCETDEAGRGGGSGGLERQEGIKRLRGACIIV